MNRVWQEGLPVTVATDDRGQPLRFTWLARTHPVVEIVSYWRVDYEWWQQRIWRDYFQVCTGTGLLVVLYEDLIRTEWFLHRLYD